MRVWWRLGHMTAGMTRLERQGTVPTVVGRLEAGKSGERGSPAFIPSSHRVFPLPLPTYLTNLGAPESRLPTYPV